METKEMVKQGIKGTQLAPPAAAQKESVRSLIESANIKGRFVEMLGQRAPQFISSVISLVNSDTMLAKATPQSVIFSAAMAATLDLPVNKNLGFAWIIGYNNKQKDGSYKVEAQFQMGYKGYIQLALRTGQYKKINVAEVYEGQIKRFNRIKEELDIDYSAPDTGNVVGYVAFFELMNGFEKLVYWTKETVEAHKKRFVKAQSFSPWVTDFDKMAKKTVLKHTIATWGILSVEMQKALRTDDATPTDMDGNEATFADISDTAPPQKETTAVEMTVNEETGEVTSPDAMAQQEPETFTETTNKPVTPKFF